MTEMFARLAAPFPPDKISWRIGATTKDKDRGMAMAYIDARDVADRLDEVCTPSGWCNDYPHANGKTVCRIGIKCDGEWVFKADGAGDSDIEAEKGALSGAFKRAAVRWGVGRYLYDIPSVWVDLETANGRAVIKPSELDRLRKALERHAGAQQAARTPAPVQRATPPAGPSRPSAAPPRVTPTRFDGNRQRSEDRVPF